MSMTCLAILPRLRLDRHRRRFIAALAVGSLLSFGCSSGAINEGARDACEAEYGVGNCVLRSDDWVPLASATSTTIKAITTSTTTTSTTTAPPKHDVSGSVEFDQRATKVNPAGAWEKEQCEGIKGYDDMHVGTPVTIRDSAGTVIATGQMSRGEWFNVDRRPDGWEFGACRLHFVISSVPHSDFYSFQIGGRDPYAISRAELASDGWVLRLYL